MKVRISYQAAGHKHDTLQQADDARFAAFEASGELGGGAESIIPCLEVDGRTIPIVGGTPNMFWWITMRNPNTPEPQADLMFSVGDGGTQACLPTLAEALDKHYDLADPIITWLWIPLGGRMQRMDISEVPGVNDWLIEACEELDNAKMATVMM